MEELFGVSMDTLMIVMLAIFCAIMAVVLIMAWRNKVMLKLGLRNIPRRKGQTALIIVGSMLSAVIVAAAFGTGDTISFSIRSGALDSLGAVDEVVTAVRTDEDFGSIAPPYFPEEQFDRLAERLKGSDDVDGLVPYITEILPTFNVNTSLSQGQTNLVAPDPAHMEGFALLRLDSGRSAPLEDVARGEVYINEEGADELNAEPGHTLHIFVGDEPMETMVIGIVENGGLAGIEPTIMMPLSHAQELLGRQGQINTISISNTGDARQGELLSDSVSETVRTFYADGEAIIQLLSILSRPEFVEQLSLQRDSLSGDLRADVDVLIEELSRPELLASSDPPLELVRILTDDDVADVVRNAASSVGGPEEGEALAREVDTILSNTAGFNVFEVKRIFLELADQAGSSVTTLFVMFGLFSVIVGTLLIFLIFVMLSAARRTEMGMVRAVGGKRSHLVQMFVFEGTAYDLAASAIGVTVGLLVSMALVAVLNFLFGKIDVDFSFTYHIEPRSVIVAYCLGMIIVFATASVSAYRVSRMNIVEAVRGLPETTSISAGLPFVRRLMYIPQAMFQPLRYLVQAAMDLRAARYSRFWLALGGAVVWMPVFSPLWWVGLAVAIFRFAYPYLVRGWLTILMGVVLYYIGVHVSKQVAPFTIGVSLMVIGVGLMLRTGVLRRPSWAVVIGAITTAGGSAIAVHGIVKPDVLSIVLGVVLALVGAAMVRSVMSTSISERSDLTTRLSFTFIGVMLLAFWILPFDTMDPITGELNSNFEMFVVSGVIMVAAAVWTVMYNADLITSALTSTTSKLGRFRPVLITAVAYPMSAKFRTGLTLAMFSLVVFTMIVMSMVIEAFGNTFADPERVLGGWDIEGGVAFASPISDIDAAIREAPDLSPGEFEAIGGYVSAPVEVRQVDSRDSRWADYVVHAVDDGFLEGSGYDFRILSEGYGPEKEAVWQSLRDDPTLAVLDAATLPDQEQEGFDSAGNFTVSGVSTFDDSMQPFDIDVRVARTDQHISYTVIAILDNVADFRGIIVPKLGIDSVSPVPVPVVSYRFKAAEGVDVAAAADRLEAAFVANGMEARALEEELEDQVAFISSFYDLLIGYMGLGIVVGVAGLGVISMRAVVERRQQIGVLRAIGYRQWMIQLSFLLESSFIALAGVGIGIALGSVVSYNIVDAIGDEIEGIRFGIPWLQIVIIIAVTYLFSMLTTWWPARQASNTPPAEALRYE